MEKKKMYIDSVFYEDYFPMLNKKHYPNIKMRSYYSDLYKRYQCNNNFDIEKPSYHYDEMGKLLFSLIQDKISLSEIGFIFIPKWGYAWKTEYTAIELHWMEKYKWTDNIIDV